MERYVHKKVEKKRLREKLSTDRQKRADFSRGKHRGYDHRRVERRWQRVWAKTGLYRTGQLSKVTGQTFYILDMFPYPSGEGLHVGHPKGYIATDAVSRMKRMQGHSVLHPMGFDAFGLPAENYAIKTKTNPETAVKRNVARYKKQLEILGFDYDWSREINTTDPAYYKWTQWIFLELFKKGLAYQSNEPINWCPSCKTGLANEDVEVGRCERCGTPVEKRKIRQWVLKITDYAEALLADLEKLNWPEHIKEQQRNWIGRSEGMLFTAPVKGTNLKIQTFSAHFEAFAADTFVVIAPDHPFLPELVKETPMAAQVLYFAKRLLERRTAAGYEEKELEGIFTGRFTVDPVGNGDLPIWVASYALADYGTGIVKCSCHDERDFKFAKKYGLRLKPVLFPKDVELRRKVKNLEVCFTDMREGILSEPKEFDGRRAREARNDVIRYLEENKIAARKVTYRLKDWVFSRQRYWGEPIPLIFCEKCKKQAENHELGIMNQEVIESSKNNNSKFILHNSHKFSLGELMNPGWVAVPEKDLPVKLPKVKYYEPTGTGESPLAAIEKWVNAKCPRCGGKGKRETNTMPQWAGSSWYYLAYILKHNSKFMLHNSFAKRSLAKWLPVDLYVGGAEHATRHLIYARFWHKFLYDSGIVSVVEPFMKLQPVGLIMGEDGRKMSKRFGNVINPDEIVERFGADSLRVYEMFMGPFDQSISWNTNGLVGAKRFLEKVWRIRFKIYDLRFKNKTDRQPIADNRQLKILLHQTIKKVTEDIEHLRFNTAVSALMILANAFDKEPSIARADFEIFLKLLAPFAPHISEELWSALGTRKSVHNGPWPSYDERLVMREDVIIAVQVDGRIRGDFEATRGLSRDELKKRAVELPSLQRWLEGKEVRSVIVVPDRLVNIVLT